MEGIYWVVVANSNFYKIYHYDKNDFSLIAEQSDPDAKKRNQDLTSDREGRFTSSAGIGTYDGHADAKKDEIERFLVNAVDKCEEGRVSHKYNKVILLVPSRVDGILAKHMNKNLKQLVVNNVKQDLTHLSEKELHHYVRDFVQQNSSELRGSVC
jgi:protein required for attachment to host cells